MEKRMRIIAASIIINFIIAAKATAFILNQSNTRRGDTHYTHGHRTFSSAATTARAHSSSPPDERSPRDGDRRAAGTMEAIRSRLTAHGLELPPPGGPKANYRLVHRDGDLLYLSGHLPMKADGTLVVGACAPPDIIAGDESGKWLSTEQGYEAARHCALNLLSTLQSYLSAHDTASDDVSGVPRPADLSRVAKVVKLFGIVRSHPDFAEQHLVMNGASDTLGQVLGEDVGACHARSAIGTNSLPLGICVEVEMIAKISGC